MVEVTAVAMALATIPMVGVMVVTVMNPNLMVTSPLATSINTKSTFNFNVILQRNHILTDIKENYETTKKLS